MCKPLPSLVLAGLAVDEVLLPSPDHIVLLARPQSRAAACPLCGRPSTRVHSRYSRRLADLPWHGRIVELQVNVRRFRCPNEACHRRIFAERLPAVAAVKARLRNLDRAALERLAERALACSTATEVRALPLP